MISERDTNFVYLADTLLRDYSALSGQVDTALRTHDVGVGIIHGTNDIWCRDYMPVQVATNRFVQFVYRPDYLSDDPESCTPPEIARAVLATQQCESTAIVLDGGNLVHCRDTAILTDKIFPENRDYGREALLRELKALLHVDRIITIPSEPGEAFGHADGVVRFVNEETVVVNDYKKVSRRYRDKLLRIFRKHGLQIIEIPYAPNLKSRARIPPATGVYVNFISSENLLLVPAYGLPEDQAAVRILANAYGSNAVLVDCRALAADGGALNCISWNIRVRVPAQRRSAALDEPQIRQ